MAGPFSDSVPDLLETILHQCAEADPHPWYPKRYAERTGTARDRLDLPLENLRMAGLVRITDWVQGSGQGYVLTPAGAEVLNNPRLLARMRNGQLPTAPPEPDLPPLQERTRPYQEKEQLHEEFVNAGTPIVTRALLLLNVIVFIVGYALAVRGGLPAGVYFKASPTNREQENLYHAILHDTGGLGTWDVVAGQWWRLLTCAFVHKGLFHLGTNMFGVYAFGQVLERMWGRWRFLTIYLVSALGGSVAAMIFGPFPGGVVGASGALCGMLASAATFIFLNRRRLSEEDVARWKRNLITNFILVLVISFIPGVSKEGHFGGAVAGLIVGVPLNMQRFARGGLRWLAVAGVLAVPVACFAAMVYVRNTAPPWRELTDVFQRIQVVEEQIQRERDFRDRVLPTCRDARTTASEAIRQSNLLLQQDPENRPEDKVKASQESLAQAIADLEGAKDALNGVDVAQLPQLEDIRPILVLYFDALQGRCTLAQEYLKEKQRLAGKPHQEYLKRLHQVGEVEAKAKQILR